MNGKIIIYLLGFALMMMQIPNVFAQRTVLWQGGTPGQESEWSCPKNWSNYRVPDEFSNVIIIDVSSRSKAYPILKDGTEINALRLEGNAFLTVSSTGVLSVRNDVFISHEENFQIEGELRLLKERDLSGEIAIVKKRGKQ